VDGCYIDWLSEYYEISPQTPSDYDKETDFSSISFQKNTEFIKDYFQKKGVIIYDVQYSGPFLKESVEDSGGWGDYDLTVTVSESDFEKMLQFGFNGMSKPAEFTNNSMERNSTEKIWIGTILTQCANPWDRYTYQEYQKWREENNVTRGPFGDEGKNLELDIIQTFYEQKGAKIFDKKIVSDVVPGALCEGCGCNAGGHGFYFLVSNDSIDLFDTWYKFEDGIGKYSEETTWFFTPISYNECNSYESPLCQHAQYYDKTCEMNGILLDESGEIVYGLIKGMYQEFVTVDYSLCDAINASVTMTTDKDEYYIGEEITFYITNDGDVPVYLFNYKEGFSISVNGIKIGHASKSSDSTNILEPGEKTKQTWNQVIWPNRVEGYHSMETAEYITNPETMWRHTKINTYDIGIEFNYQKSQSFSIPVKIIEGYQWEFVSEQRSGNCEWSYPDVCIPPYPPDLDCGEIGYSNFRVIGDDPHGFDRDNDGIGCVS